MADCGNMTILQRDKKVKLSVCVIKPHTMMAYGEWKYSSTYWHQHNMENSGQHHPLATIFQERDLYCLLHKRLSRPQSQFTSWHSEGLKDIYIVTKHMFILSLFYVINWSKSVCTACPRQQCKASPRILWLKIRNFHKHMAHTSPG
jgi:hypothetical protein